MKMKWGSGRSFWGLALAILLASAAAQADELILKNGQIHSGKFIRGDASIVDFRTGGRIESFPTSEVERIVFKKPALDSGTTRTTSAQPTPGTQIIPADQVPPGTSSSSPQVTFPEGTSLRIRTVDSIDTRDNDIGDSFAATLVDPLQVGDQVVAPRGSEIVGRISYAKESGRMTGQSELALELKQITVDGRAYKLSTADYMEIGASQSKRTAATVGGGAAIGAIIGAIAGGGKGAGIGAATGAAAGTAARVLTRGETLRVPAETLLEFRLDSKLTIALP